jgi:hypothetical protein
MVAALSRIFWFRAHTQYRLASRKEGGRVAAFLCAAASPPSKFHVIIAFATSAFHFIGSHLELDGQS